MRKYRRKTVAKRRSYKKTYKKSPAKRKTKVYGKGRQVLSNRALYVPHGTYNPFPQRTFVKLSSMMMFTVPIDKIQPWAIGYIPINGMIDPWADFYYTGTGSHAWGASGTNVVPLTPQRCPNGYLLYQGSDTVGESGTGYKNYRVHASRITLEPICRSMADMGYIYITPKSSSTSRIYADSVNADYVFRLQETPGAKKMSYGLNSSNAYQKKLSSYIKCHTLEGLTPTAYNSDLTFTSIIGQNPDAAAQNYWQIGYAIDVIGTDTKITAPLTFRVYVDWYVEFFNPRTITQPTS